MSALFEYLNALYEALESKKRVLSVFFDLSNSFGTEVLLATLEKSAVRGCHQLCLGGLEG
jgi:hypothetical protein